MAPWGRPKSTKKITNAANEKNLNKTLSSKEDDDDDEMQIVTWKNTQEKNPSNDDSGKIAARSISNYKLALLPMKNIAARSTNINKKTSIPPSVAKLPTDCDESILTGITSDEMENSMLHGVSSNTTMTSHKVSAASTTMRESLTKQLIFHDDKPYNQLSDLETDVVI